MAEYTIENLEVTPFFDIELFMNVSQETRVGGKVMETLGVLWEKWIKELNARRISFGKVEYLAVWLNESVEEEVDKAWEEKPSEAFMHNALAQTICMGAVHSLLPEIEDAGCAPAPKVTERLQEALESIGMPYKDDGPTLARRYAVVTHFPFKGACEICSLQSNCPKGQGQTGNSSSIVLPGYERGPGE